MLSMAFEALQLIIPHQLGAPHNSGPEGWTCDEILRLYIVSCELSRHGLGHPPCIALGPIHNSDNAGASTADRNPGGSSRQSRSLYRPISGDQSFTVRLHNLIINTFTDQAYVSPREAHGKG